MNDHRSLSHSKRKRKYHAISFRVRLKRAVLGRCRRPLSGPPVQIKPPALPGDTYWAVF